MTKIEWATDTINPIIGCSKISAGCDNCYAEKMAVRLSHMDTEGYDEVLNHAGKWNGRTAFVPSQLGKPMKWKKPRRIFVCSMGDLFHNSVSDDHQLAVFEMMRKAYWHTFFVLTKRPENMREFIRDLQANKGPDFIRWPLPNVYLGVTAENQEQADKRIPELMKMDGCTKFVSVEPMLGPVDLSPWLPHFMDFSYTTDPGRLNWVICGGESGPGARPMHPKWARDLRDQCDNAEVPFFFKQWGEWLPFGQEVSHAWRCNTKPNQFLVDGDAVKGGPFVARAFKDDGMYAYRVGKKAAGRLLDGVTYNEYPEK